MLKHPFGEYKFDIKSYNAGKDGNLTLPSLFLFLQECAWDNARLNDFGYEFLKSKNAFWVLSRILVQMDKYPVWKDEIKIKTWPKGTDGIFALRDFEIIEKENVIGRVTTSWLILDIDTKRPQKLDGFNFFHENFIKEEAIAERLGKINFTGGLEKLDVRKVYYSDLDINKHVNNASYVKWVVDTHFAEKNFQQINEFEINFISELALNDEFTLYQGQNTEGKKFYVIKNEKGQDVCKVSIK